jgi:hypothetical protein
MKMGFLSDFGGWKLIEILGCDIDVWTFDELKMIVKDFKDSHDSVDEEISCKFCSNNGLDFTHFSAIFE